MYGSDYMNTKKAFLKNVTISLDYSLHEAAVAHADEIGQERGFSGLVARVLAEELGRAKPRLSATRQPESPAPAQALPVIQKRKRGSSAA